MNTSKLSFLLQFISLVFAITTIFTTSVTYLDSKDWGLISRLPAIYWIGLLLLGVSMFLNLRNNSLNIKNNIFNLLLIIVYVTFLPMLIEGPVGLSQYSLWPSSESNELITTGYISITQPRMLMSYESWPFFTILSSTFMIITGVPLIVLAKYFPFFTIAFWAILVFLISRKFLKTEYSLLSTALFICGSWTRQQYFGPQSIAFSLFLLFIYLITKDSNFGFGAKKRTTLILVFITFIGSLFFHALTPLIMVSIIFAAYFVSKLFARSAVQQTKSNFCFCLLCFSCLISYNVYVTPAFFKNAFNTIFDSLSKFAISNPAQQLSRLSGSQFQQFTNISTYLIVVLLTLVSTIALIYMFKKKLLPSLQLSFWFGALGILFSVAFLPYGTQEAPFRAFIFALPFLSIICIYVLKKKPVIIGCLLFLTLIASVPASYGSDSYRLATSPELFGSQYCSRYLPEESVLFYKNPAYVRFFDPSKVFTFVSLGRPPFTNYNATSTTLNLNATDYFILSRNQQNFYEYYLGFNPFESINLTGNPSLANARLYDNGNYSVFDSRGFG